MSEFRSVLETTPLTELTSHAEHAGNHDVTRALDKDPGGRDLADFAALLSEAASARLEEIAEASHQLTVARFGRTVHMYAPVYLSNECLTTCTYCGFAKGLPIARKTLSDEETLAEAGHLLARGFRSILLLTGEHQKLTGVDFLEKKLRLLAPIVPNLAVEVQVWSEEQYLRLRNAGCDGVVVYQETYNRDTYARYHLAGRKRDYEWRLGAPERAGRAGMRRIGIGALLGLHEPWREDAVATAAHALFLTRTFWRSEISVSLPRIRPSASGYAPDRPVADRDVAQLVCAFRLLLPDAAIVMSSREAPSFRDGLIRLGVTHTSAGSHTEPGGYTHPKEAEEQFEVSDLRGPEEVAEAIRTMGYDVVWKDWAQPLRARA